MSIEVPSYIDLIKEVRNTLDLGLKASKDYTDKWIGGITAWQNTPVKNVEGVLYSFRTRLANHQEMLESDPVEFTQYELYCMAVKYLRNYDFSSPLTDKAHKFINQFEMDNK